MIHIRGYGTSRLNVYVQILSMLSRTGDDSYIIVLNYQYVRSTLHVRYHYLAKHLSSFPTLDILVRYRNHACLSINCVFCIFRDRMSLLPSNKAGLPSATAARRPVMEFSRTLLDVDVPPISSGRSGLDLLRHCVSGVLIGFLEAFVAPSSKVVLDILCTDDLIHMRLQSVTVDGMMDA
jgi:hypothetical protein